MTIKPRMDIIRGAAFELDQALGYKLQDEIPALIGNPDGGAIYVDENTRTEIYVHDDGSTISGASIISAAGIPKEKLRFKQPILIKLSPNGSYRYVGIDDQSDTLYSAGNTETATGEPIYLEQLNYGTIHPVSGLQVFVKGADYNDTWIGDLPCDPFDGTAQDTSMVSITPPTTNNRQIAVLIQMYADNGVLEYKQGSEYSAAINKENAEASGKLPTKDADRYRVGHVFLKTGMTTITYDDIWSRPELITSGSGGMTSFTLTADSGSDQTVEDSESLDIAGGTGIDTVVGATNTVTVAIDSTVATLSGSQTLTNKTIDADDNPISNIGAAEVSHDLISGQTNITALDATADYLLAYDADANVLKKILALNLVAIQALAILWDQKTSGTNGGGSSAATWNARDLNTEHHDPLSIVSVSSNQFTPIEGQYIIFASVPGNNVGLHRARLYNVTGTAVVQEGQNARVGAAAGVVTHAFLLCTFSANGTDAYRIDHYTTSAIATSGLGSAVSDGSAEIYTEVYLAKVA